MTSDRGGKTQIEQGLAAILGALGDALDEISRRANDPDGGEVYHVHAFDTEKGPVRAEAGLRVRFAGGDTPGARQSPPGAGAAQRRPKAPVRTSAAAGAKGPSEPVAAGSGAAEKAPSPIRSMEVDIAERDGAWRLMADVPGVRRDGIRLAVDEGTLVIRAEGRRIYEARVPCPGAPDAADFEVSVNNGILEIALPRAEGGA